MMTFLSLLIMVDSISTGSIDFKETKTHHTTCEILGGQCDLSGEYFPMQCDTEEIDLCYCVDKEGNILSGTHVFKKGEQTCTVTNPPVKELELWFDAKYNNPNAMAYIKGEITKMVDSLNGTIPPDGIKMDDSKDDLFVGLLLTESNNIAVAKQLEPMIAKWKLNTLGNDKDGLSMYDGDENHKIQRRLDTNTTSKVDSSNWIVGMVAMSAFCFILLCCLAYFIYKHTNCFKRVRCSITNLSKAKESQIELEVVNNPDAQI